MHFPAKNHVEIHGLSMRTLLNVVLIKSPRIKISYIRTRGLHLSLMEPRLLQPLGSISLPLPQRLQDRSQETQSSSSFLLHTHRVQKRAPWSLPVVPDMLSGAALTQKRLRRIFRKWYLQGRSKWARLVPGPRPPGSSRLQGSHLCGRA